MKKFWKYLAISAIAVGALPMASCSDDDAVDPYTLNYCYVYQPNSTYAQLEYKANGEFLVDIANPLQVMPVRLTKPATRDLNITVAIDESLVAEYNEANGTSYKFLTGCSIINPTLKIKAGEYISTKTVTETIPDPDDESGEGTISNQVVVNDSITVSFGDMSGFRTGDVDLILPIVITNGDGTTISKSSRIFLTFSSNYKANMISCKYLTQISNNPDIEGWETANTNLSLVNFFRSQWAADDEIQISATINNSKIDAYNVENVSNLLPLAGTSVKNPTITIAEGSFTANLDLTLGDYSGIANGEEYLIPIDLAITKGEGAELETSTVYVAVINIPNEIYGADYGSGLSKVTPESSWTAMLYGADYEEESNFLFDGSMYTSVEPGDVIECNLGSVKTLDAFALRWYAYYYMGAEIENIQTSVDGVKWVDWGSAAAPSTYASTWYLSFSKPAKFQYIRWTIGEEGEYSWGMYVRNVYFYTK